MTVFVLIVEDEADFSDELVQVFAELDQPIQTRVVKSRDSAFAAIEEEYFDLIVLDLKIPTIDGALDAEPAHGHSVFARARLGAAGTPIFVLTGSPSEDFIPAMLASAQQVDVWGEGRPVGTIDFLQKYKFEECPQKLGPIVTAIHRLSDVELSRGGVNLSIPEERLVRIFARKFSGTRCAVSRLGGGLSGAKVLRLKITDSNGTMVHDAVGKLGSPREISDEASRFDKFVARLDPHATPRKLATIDFGAGGFAGVFYGLAAGFESSAFEVALKDDELAATAVRGIANATSNWSKGVPESSRKIADIRRRVLSDDSFISVTETFEIAWVIPFENVRVQTRWCCVHGDLHGSNALVSDSGAAILIDYGDVGEGTASLDPITLELSTIFHPQGVERGSWPTLEQAAQWGDLDVYLHGCPFSAFVRECRLWADAVGVGQREIAATAYAYLMRQLKYDDTDKKLALALINGVKNYYDKT
ncbi:response regulator [Brucella anthropi]|uniref:response regulator n=1 Tax=Brucella anthropi TaxID=529 RepID=UPI001639A211|nr:response regulator [Brucella anthropi]